MTKKSALLILGLTCYFYVMAQSRPDLLDQPALTGTVEIKYNGGTATSFQYKGNDSVGYLITAKHVFASKFKKEIIDKGTTKYKYYDSLAKSDGDQVAVQIYYSGNWLNIEARLYFDNDNSDVAILQTNIPMAGNNYDFNIYGKSFFYCSQECYFIGYPLGLRQKGVESPYPLPFVRKGIISAFGEWDKNILTKIYIDGHNTYGFSGGPVLCYDLSNKLYFVVGVISGYIPQRNHQYREDGTEEITEENSGLMEVYSIEFARKIFRRLHCM